MNMIKFLKAHRKITLVSLLALIFLANFAAHYVVYHSRHYIQQEYSNLILARNLAQTGLVSYESRSNVVLSTTELSQSGMPAELGNKLTFFLYGLIFRVFGFNPEWPVFIAMALYSLAAVFIFLTIRRLTDLKIGLVAAGLNLALPFFLAQTNTVGNQEWGFAFLAVAAFFYFWPRKRSAIFIILTALFLGLAVAAKNSYCLTIAPFLLLELWRGGKSAWRESIFNVVIMSLVFLLIVAPLTLASGNEYLSELLYFTPDTNQSISSFGYVFPDAYTYHYEKQDYLNKLYANPVAYSGSEFTFWGDTGSFLAEYGMPINFWQSEVVTRIFSAWIYLKGFLSPIVFGGLLTWLLIFVGLRELFRKKENHLLIFSAVFLAAWFALMIGLRTSNYSQFLIILFPILLAAAIGLWRLSELLAEFFQTKGTRTNQIAGVTAWILLLFFAQNSWVYLSRFYLNENLVLANKILALARSPQSANLFDAKGVTAVGWTQDVPNLLNYYLDKNFIYFAPQTVQKLADQGKLAQVFKNYGVTGFIGYDDQLVQAINKNTNNKLKSYSIDQ